MNHSAATKSRHQVSMSKKLFGLFTETLNEVHGKQFSERFYTILLEDHVRAMVNFENELKAVPPDIPVDKLSLNNSLVSSAKERYRRKIVQLAKNMLTRKNRSKRKEIMGSTHNISLGLSGLSKGEIDSLKELPAYDPYFFGSGDVSKRQAIYTIADRYEDNFIKNGIRLLPGYVIEYFQNAYEAIPVIEPEEKIFHVLQLRFSEYDSLFIAKYIEQGSKLYWYQDGQEMAELAFKYARHHQNSIADQFRTWGWKENEKDVPWKAYPLEKFSSKYSIYQNSEEYDIMLCYPLLNSDNKLFNQKSTKYFLENIKPDIELKILVRPYPVSRKQTNAGQLDFITDKRVTVSTGLDPIAKEMSKSKIVIQMEIPSTNFMECIYVNHPGMGLILNDQPTELIKPVYKEFKDLGIYHSNMKSMVEFINRINIEEWWPSILQSKAMQEFKKKFASETVPGREGAGDCRRHL